MVGLSSTRGEGSTTSFSTGSVVPVEVAAAKLSSTGGEGFSAFLSSTSLVGLVEGDAEASVASALGTLLPFNSCEILGIFKFDRYWSHNRVGSCPALITSRKTPNPWIWDLGG